MTVTTRRKRRRNKENDKEGDLTCNKEIEKEKEKEKGKAFVTVGTTKFEKLISALDRMEVLEALVCAGYTRLTLQIGHGEYTPSTIVSSGRTKGRKKVKGKWIDVEYFRLAPSLQTHMDESSLVISHAGAGSLFEALNAGRRVIAVPNPGLMVNHQEELAQHLAGLGYLLHSNLDSIPTAITEMETAQFKKYKPQDARKMVKKIDSLF